MGVPMSFLLGVRDMRNMKMFVNANQVLADLVIANKSKNVARAIAMVTRNLATSNFGNCMYKGVTYRREDEVVKTSHALNKLLSNN